ncbi:MAG TPA: prolyl oligopeptidase family serine peptidase [Jatrophihabitans sp.]|nr:prolyl oligopeptidase family serine peptidase [Jatrophihabitans sp.]
MAFPVTRKDDQRDDFFGTVVTDEYRWLENQNAEEVQQWVKAQAELADDYLATLPGRQALSKRLDELLQLPTSTVPIKRGEHWFRLTNDGSQQQPVLRVADEPVGAGRVLIDPNPASSDGTTAIAAAVPDPSGRLVAWSYQQSGSDWKTWQVRDVETGADLPDRLDRGKFVEPCWLGDSTGFVWSSYSTDEADQYSAANVAPTLLLHLLGTDPEQDRVLFHDADRPGLYVWPWIDRDTGWLLAILQDSEADERALWACDLTDPDAKLSEIVPPSKAEWAPVGADERGFILWTDTDAPRGRLVVVDRVSGQMRELVAERAATLELAETTEDGLIVSWLVDARSEVTRHGADGTELERIQLPGLGSVTGISTGKDTTLVHLGFTSFDTPPRILQYDLAGGSSDSGRTRTVFGAEVEGPLLVTEQIWVTSADGTRLPAFVVHRADVTADTGPHPTVLYGYGGFYVNQTPAFSPGIVAWAEAGGVWVVATLRGGAEYGAAWHDAGKLANKQNVFDDAIATAEELIRLGWTTPAQLGANGGSNGGLLAGALLTQRPDLFAAVVPQVGVLDMLRYQEFTIGRAWASDYGIASRSKQEFDYLYAYSPLHNLRAGVHYPAVLLMTADHDDRVVPAHTFKFGARLQAVSPDGAIAYIRVTYGAGHGQGKSRATQLAERADLLAFMAAHTGLRF